jgi:DNA-binding MarR family transcriptional regulator
MSIETDIKQPKFKSSYQKVMVNLLFTANWHHNEHLRLLRPHDLTIQQYNVLRILKGQYPKSVRINDIIDRMLDKMSNASRLVEKLVQKKWAQRVESELDRRAVDVTITKLGMAMLVELEETEAKMEEKMLNLTSEEAETLSNLLDKLRDSKQ